MLEIIDSILGLAKDATLWSFSVPIGSESTRILKLIRQLSQTVYDFQRLNMQTPRDDFSEPTETTTSKRGLPQLSTDEYLDQLYGLVDFRLQNISNYIFSL